MKFSICITTYDRANILPKTINSILNQTYEDFELLILDDGSTDNTQEILKNYKDSRIKLLKNDIPSERIISRKKLMKAAKGDWIYWVDSDDEIVFGALEIISHNIEKYPEYSVFNFGQLVLGLGGTIVKTGHDLPDWDKEGMYHFDCGLVGTGGFIFKRECLDNIQELPNIDNFIDFADWFGEVLEEWFQENAPGAPHQAYNHEDKYCGNPWGDDFVFMWLLTRKYKSKKIPIIPYIAYIREEPWMNKRAILSGTMKC